MPTLWQMLKGKVAHHSTPVAVATAAPNAQQPVETQYYNPLNVLIGETVIKINTIDLEDKDFKIKSFREVQRFLGDKVFRYCDYRLIPTDNSTEFLLRLVPNNNPDSDQSHSVILMSYVAGFEQNEEFINGLNTNETMDEPIVDKQGNAVVDGSGDQVFDKFVRVNDVKTPWKATVITVANVNGKVAKSQSEMTYWDFWREAKDADGNDMVEFYIVELDGNHYHDIWRGAKIDANRIKVQ